MSNIKDKKIYRTMFKLIVIIVSIFVFSYAWFVATKENFLDSIEVGTFKVNNLEISKSGDDDWGSSLNIEVGEEFIFNNEVTSDGISFYKAVNKDEDGLPITLTKALENKDYLDFDLWFRNDSNITIYLDKSSRVYPLCCSDLEGSVVNNSYSRSDIIRVSNYGDFTTDLIASGVRIAFIKYNYNEKEGTYELNDTPAYIWAPNKNYEIIYNNGIYEVDLNSNNIEEYSYMKVNNSNSFVSTKLTNVKDEIKASYIDRSNNGDTELFSIISDGEVVKSGLKIRVWVEGNDRDSVEALKGGKFKFDLSFVGFTKSANNIVPNVNMDSNGNLIGLNESMEYSLDNGINWIRYISNTTVSSSNKVLVRYSETDDKLASSYVVVGGNNE